MLIQYTTRGMLEHFGVSANKDCSSLVQTCLPLFTRLILPCVLLADAVLVLGCLSSFTWHWEQNRFMKCWLADVVAINKSTRLFVCCVIRPTSHQPQLSRLRRFFSTLLTFYFNLSPPSIALRSVASTACLAASSLSSTVRYEGVELAWLIEVTRELHAPGPCMRIAEGRSMTNGQTDKQTDRVRALTTK